MNVEIHRPRPDVAVITPEGRIDAVSGPEFRKILKQQPEQGAPFLVIDLQQVPFMDSSGLSALVSALKAARKHNGTVILVRPTPQVRMTLQMSMLDRIFVIHNTVEDALESLSSLPTTTSS